MCQKVRADIFVDVESEQGSVSGTLTLSKKWVEYVEHKIVDFSGTIKTAVPKTSRNLIKNIDISPEDFQHLSLRGGDIVYAFPIYLNPREASKGDAIIVQWRSFKKEYDI